MAEDESNTITPTEMAGWFKDEVRLVSKTSELQLKEASDFVTAYLTGKISAEAAMDRKVSYEQRWGQSKLIAAMPDETTPNDEILRRYDAELREDEMRRTRRTGPSGGRGF